jgi:hypothetical protein
MKKTVNTASIPPTPRRCDFVVRARFTSGRKRTANQPRGVFENSETETQSLLERVMPEKIANATTTRWLLTIGLSDNRKTNRFHRENRLLATDRPFPDARKRGSP